jgi:probable HAF family extracellular repeat protein
MRFVQKMACAALVLAAAAAYAAPKREWTVVALPTLTEYGGTARDINNRGDIVGTSQVAPNYPHPVIWSNGTVTDLMPQNPAQGVANAVNDKGDVAYQQRIVASIWNDGKVTTTFAAGEPADINKFGGMVGYYYPSGAIASGPQRGFYFHDGILEDIGSLGNNLTAAGGVNDKGVVVGYSRLPFSSTDHAVVWQSGVLRDLGTLGGTNSYAGAVTNSGIILGSADDAKGINHMVTWDAASGALLRDYGPRLAGYAINDHGDIVGSQLDTGRPFLLEDDEYTWLLDLPAMREAGWTTFGAFGINDRGWIVGTGWKPGISTAGAPLLLIPRDQPGKPKG